MKKETRCIDACKLNSEKISYISETFFNKQLFRINEA